MDGITPIEFKDWALSTWRQTGESAVAALEGFSGIGKTQVAYELLKAWSPHSVIVSATQGPFATDELVIDIAAALELAGARGASARSDGDLMVGLRDHLRRCDDIIIIDDFENLVDPAASALPAATIRFLANVPRAARGRVLLVSGVALPTGTLPFGSTIRLATPDNNTAATILESLARQRGLLDEIDPDQVPRIAAWLGNNPRAIQAFLACLQHDSLEDLIKIDPDGWEINNLDSPVSASSHSLVETLEATFVNKTVHRLPPPVRALFEVLSAYRKPFPGEAITKTRGIADAERSKTRLVDEFLLTRQRRFYTLNPVARQIGLARLAANAKRKSNAHEYAAQFYIPRTKPPTDALRANSSRAMSNSGSAFIEARYHLISAGDTQRFVTLAQEYRGWLLASTRSLPRADELSSSELNAAISMLQAALDNEDSGHARLRTRLARYLYARGTESDQRAAMRQLQIAVRQSCEISDWRLLMELSRQLASTQEVRALVAQARRDLSPSASAEVASRAAEILCGRIPRSECLELIDPVTQGAATEFERKTISRTAYVLTRIGEYESAVSLVERAFISRRDDPLRYRFYEQGLFISRRAATVAGIWRFRALINERAYRDGQPALAEVMLQQIDNNHAEAVQIALDNTSYPAVAMQGAFSALVIEDVAMARHLLGTIPSSLLGSPALDWLSLIVALCEGDEELAKSLSSSLTVAGYEAGLVGERWLDAWVQTEVRMEKSPGFYFPVIPARLTKYPIELRHATVTAELLKELGPAHLPILDRKRERMDNKMESRDFEKPSNPTPDIGATTIGPGANVFYGGSFTIGALSSSGSAMNISALPDEATLAQLRTLALALSTSSSRESVEALAVIREAESAAESGDSSRFWGTLRKGGAWLLEKASDAGLSLASKALARSMGLE